MATYLVTYEADGEFLAEFMTPKRIADTYGFIDLYETSNYKAYRLSPDKDPEPLVLYESWERGYGHYVAVKTQEGEELDRCHIPEH